MGEVYLAEDTRLGRQVALKKVSDSRGFADGQRFLLREARAAARLNHPNIAGVYDVVEAPEGAYIVMEYVPGETLAARLDRGALSVTETIAVGVQLAKALAEAHRHGIVHRDLKPANVALSEDGRVKILDFGLAKRQADPDAGASSTPSSAGHVVGTPAYCPPENLMGLPVGARGDVYSLGVTLFQAVAGELPFKGPGYEALLTAILRDPTPSLRDVRPDVPLSLDRAVFKAMARNPEQRYGSAADFADDLESLAGELSGAPTASRARPRRTWPAAGRRRSLALGVAAALAVVAAAMAAAFSGHGPPAAAIDPARPVIAVMTLAKGGGDPREDALGAGIADVLTTSLSKITGVTVIPRSASTRSGPAPSPSTFAREIGASVVVTGSVQKIAERIRIVIHLTRPGSEAVFWSNAFDGSMEGIFGLQAEVATAVARTLHIPLSANDYRHLQSPAATDPRAFDEYSRGRALLDNPNFSGNLERAIEAFTRAIAIEPTFARAHAGAAEAHWRRYIDTREPTSADRARDMALEAVRLDPKDVAVRCALALIYAGTGRQEQAAEELRKVISEQPSSDFAHAQLGSVFFHLGRLGEAADEMRRAISLRPNYWGHHQDLGLIHYDAGRFDEALGDFRRVTELQPENAWGFQMLGTVHHAVGHREAARANYQRAIELGDARAHTNLGNLYYEDRQFAEAAAAFEQATKLEPQSPSKHRNLGDVYLKLDRPEDAHHAYEVARDLLREQLRGNPKDARARASLAVCEAKLGHRETAQKEIRQALSVAAPSADVRYKSAVVHALAGRREEGLAALAEALRQGYSVQFAEADEDLASLRSSPVYAALVKISNATEPKESAH
jgi:tetratricopeptide (TPR) repeat protein/TolB-like protein